MCRRYCVTALPPFQRGPSTSWDLKFFKSHHCLLWETQLQGVFQTAPRAEIRSVSPSQSVPGVSHVYVCVIRGACVNIQYAHGKKSSRVLHIVYDTLGFAYLPNTWLDLLYKSFRTWPLHWPVAHQTDHTWKGIYTTHKALVLSIYPQTIVPPFAAQPRGYTHTHTFWYRCPQAAGLTRQVIYCCETGYTEGLILGYT